MNCYLKNRTPALAFNLARDPRLFPFPEHEDINERTVTQFVLDFIKDKLVPFQYFFINCFNIY